MHSENVLVTSAEGFHARPAAALAKAAQAYEASVTIQKADAVASAKSMLSLLSLSVMPGDTIRVCVDGDDEETIAKRLAALISSDFAEG